MARLSWPWRLVLQRDGPVLGFTVNCSWWVLIAPLQVLTCSIATIPPQMKGEKWPTTVLGEVERRVSLSCARVVFKSQEDGCKYCAWSTNNSATTQTSLCQFIEKCNIWVKTTNLEKKDWKVLRQIISYRLYIHYSWLHFVLYMCDIFFRVPNRQPAPIQ